MKIWTTFDLQNKEKSFLLFPKLNVFLNLAAEF